MEIRRISKKQAEDFFHEFEHLGNCGLGVWHFGCYSDKVLMAVVSFGSVCFDPNHSKLGKYAKDNDMKIIQLNRGGTRYDAPPNVPSQSVSLALKEVRKMFGNTIIVAYSDTDWNEIGTIYQSTNFIYLGLTDPKGQSNYIIDGKRMSGWTVRKKYGTRDMKRLTALVNDVVRIPLTKKHMYVFINARPLKKKMTLKYFRDSVKPYPKRKELCVGSMLEIRKR